MEALQLLWYTAALIEYKPSRGWKKWSQLFQAFRLDSPPKPPIIENIWDRGDKMNDNNTLSDFNPIDSAEIDDDRWDADTVRWTQYGRLSDGRPAKVAFE